MFAREFAVKFEPFKSAENFLSTTEEALKSLLSQRGAIISLMDEMKGGKLESSLCSGPPALRHLFRTPLAPGEARDVHAYEQFAPGLQIGFDTDRPAVIRVAQRPSTEADPPSGCHFDFAIEVVDHADSSWISFEAEVDAPSAIRPAVWTVAVRLASEREGRVETFLFLRRRDGAFHRVEIGCGEIGPDQRSLLFSRRIEHGDVSDIDPSAPARLVLFLPVGANYRATLTHVELFISEPPQ